MKRNTYFSKNERNIYSNGNRLHFPEKKKIIFIFFFKKKEKKKPQPPLRWFAHQPNATHDVGGGSTTPRTIWSWNRPPLPIATH